MSIINDLNYIKQTKENIKLALIEKGAEIGDNATFRSYVDIINNLNVSVATASFYFVPITRYNRVVRPAEVTAVTLSITEIKDGVEQEPVIYSPEGIAPYLYATSNRYNFYIENAFIIGKTYKISCTAYTGSCTQAGVFAADDTTTEEVWGGILEGDPIYTLDQYTETVTITEDLYRYYDGLYNGY